MAEKAAKGAVAATSTPGKSKIIVDETDLDRQIEELERSIHETEE